MEQTDVRGLVSCQIMILGLLVIPAEAGIQFSMLWIPARAEKRTPVLSSDSALVLCQLLITVFAVVDFARNPPCSGISGEIHYRKGLWAAKSMF
jgi:hypothetical protein